MEGSENNNPPGHVVLLIDDQVNNSAALPTLPHINESMDDNDNDDVSPTACSSMAAGSNITDTSTTALDWLVDGSGAPPTSTTALNLPVNESDDTRMEDATDSGVTDDNETPNANGALGNSCIPPMIQST